MSTFRNSEANGAEKVIVSGRLVPQVRHAYLVFRTLSRMHRVTNLAVGLVALRLNCLMVLRMRCIVLNFDPGSLIAAGARAVPSGGAPTLHQRGRLLLSARDQGVSDRYTSVTGQHKQGVYSFGRDRICRNPNGPRKIDGEFDSKNITPKFRSVYCTKPRACFPI